MLKSFGNSILLLSFFFLFGYKLLFTNSLASDYFSVKGIRIVLIYFVTNAFLNLSLIQLLLSKVLASMIAFISPLIII